MKGLVAASITVTD